MPELPEVETTKNGIMPHLAEQTIDSIVVRNAKLRWPVPSRMLKKQLPGAKITDVSRRAKYILITTNQGTLIVHLGMSGSIRVLDKSVKPEKHDHIDLLLKNGAVLRYRDPRRFGAFVWAGNTPLQHPLLAELGPEPLQASFNGKYLYTLAQKSKRAIKLFIMDHHIVVGVGNIYASESLFLAHIHPKRISNTLTLTECNQLCKTIKQVLKQAIKSGGTTLQDFQQADGKPGYFKQKLLVYKKQGEPCSYCGSQIKSEIIGQRNSFYCTRCQK